MAKKQKQVATPIAKENISLPAGNLATEAKETKLSLLNFKVQAIIIAFLGLVFYANTFTNEFALDDRPIVVQNEFVKQGFAGIPKILTSDAFASYLNQQNSGNALAGGRYRPLSIVTFSIEQQLLGLPAPVEGLDNPNEPKSNHVTEAAAAKVISDMHVRHVVSVLIFIFSVIVLLYFLRTIVFPGNAVIPFVAAILFTIHPIHTEVVANVKSRDEIMSLLFICLTFIYAFRYRDYLKKPDLYKALLCYFAALLSKEYGIALVVLLPLSLYIFRKDSIENSFRFFSPFLIPMALYGFMRFAAEARTGGGITDDIMNIPYLYATTSQKIASITAVLFDYFRLLVFPHPLSADYSFNQVPYKNFSHPLFWVSLFFYAGVVASLILLFKKRHVLTFAIAFYLVNLGLVGNILVDIGAPMGERLIYHSSVGFVIVIAYLLYHLFNKIKPEKVGMGIMAALLLVIIVFSGYKTIERNKDWKNDKVLFLHDVVTSPNSVLILSNAGSAKLDLADEEKDSVIKNREFWDAIGFLDRTLAINPKFANGYQNRGVAYYKLGLTDKAVENWDSTRKYNPGHPLLPYVYSIASNYYFIEGMKHGRANEHELAITSFKKATHCNPHDGDIWYNLGYANMLSKHYAAAMDAFDKALRFKTKNPNARSFYEQCRIAIGNTGIPDTLSRSF